MSPVGAFELDFLSREAAVALFEEGTGPLLTDGTRACMERTHLNYGAQLSYGTRGLLLTLDGSGLTCGHGSQIAVGHLASRERFTYGDFEWTARIHHAPDGAPPPANSFNCFSAYVHDWGAPWNELAWCFDAADPFAAHMSAWHDDTMHRTIHRLDHDLTRTPHHFTTRWRETGVDWLIDGVVVHQLRGEARRTVPWLPMSMRIILRPHNKPSHYLGPAQRVR